MAALTFCARSSPLLGHPLLSPFPAARKSLRQRSRPSFGDRTAAAMSAPLPGVELVHIARETKDVPKMSKFYQEVLGFEKMDTPKFPTAVEWLRFGPGGLSLHIIEHNPDSCLPESPLNAPPNARLEPSALSQGHHLSFRVSDYEKAVGLLKERGIPIHEKTQQDGKIKQAFFFDPDGNGLEVGSWPEQ